ncbi:hypothetical protein POTOM_047155 [Populus tomentosa]|uniref:Dienelactone hydrolase domain-containing protein n=1 Tax=Populus tomentosa TaxID=118781 RepID=A0A8X7YJI2_POPTO|nr:hypothetical protein POTOM_047155 [Populus tomentosa]
MLLFAGRVTSVSSSSASRIFAAASRNPFSISGSRFQVRAMAGSASQPFKKIQIQRDDTTFDAYVVGKEDAPGIVVLQEWWGVDFEIKNHAVKISQLGPGFKALIPDLYRGKVGLDVAEAQHLMDGLDWQGAVKDIQASVNWLKTNGSSKALVRFMEQLRWGMKWGGGYFNCSHTIVGDAWCYQIVMRVWGNGVLVIIEFGPKHNSMEAYNNSTFSLGLRAGVTGFCMGGALSIASSVLVPEVDAVVAFYGVPSSQLADPAQAKAPVQAHFGELDNFVGFSDVTAAKALEEKLKASGIPYEVHIYPGNAHAFMNRSPEGVKRRKGMGLPDEDEASAELAWSRFTTWMTRYLSA